MTAPPTKKQYYVGIGLAVLATIIWSGNFIIARGVATRIPPISLAFFRWLTASLIMWPIAYKKFSEEKEIVFGNVAYILWTALFGITIFNTLVYFAGHYSPAINLALIGTTSSPVFSIIMAALFLGEKIKPLRIVGLVLCIIGIVVLIARGSWEQLMNFHFSSGDILILLGGFAFAVYTIFVKQKPAAISNVNFLFVIFTTGTLLLLPFFTWETFHTPPIPWDLDLVLIILYLGLGTSVISFLGWNIAISRLGAARTSLFGNLIPVFASLEAVWILGEKLTWIHLACGVTVIAGLIIANLKGK